MVKVFQSLARSRKGKAGLRRWLAKWSRPFAFICAVSISHSQFFTLSTSAAVVEFRPGVRIEYTGGAVSWPDGVQTGDLVLTFTDTENPGTFKLPSYAKAWILSVGGGGAGGTVAASGSGHGSGGGGGAGGFIEKKTELLVGGTYTITVGAGGLPGTDTVGTLAAGNDGNPSYIKLGDTELTDYTAFGGGGGGAECAGRGNGTDGKKLASGGGGSLSSSGAFAGGAGMGGQGSAGGNGGHYNAAGGGGGADGNGNSTTKSASGGSGSGGDGKPSRITCAEGAEPVNYAGGGGGGIVSGTAAVGGTGGGGSGAGGMSGTKTIVEPGVDGFGGGGGGGNHKQIGGKGGNGVVIIRISEALAGDPVKPVPPVEMPQYEPDGVMLVPPSLAYTVTGGCATNIGETYHCVVTLESGFTWSDGSRDVVEFDWKILPQELVKPGDGVTFQYDGENHVAIQNPNPGLVFTDLESGGKTNEVNAGDYRYMVRPKDENYVWKGAAEGKEREEVTVKWSITPKPVNPPPAPELQYNRGNQVAFTTLEEGCVYESGVTNSTVGGTFRYTLALKSTNYAWAGVEPGKEHDPLEVTWRIEPMRVEPPAFTASFVYNNTLRTACDPETFEPADAYKFADGSVYQATEVGDYTFKLTLLNETGEENFIWDESGTSSDLAFDWSIMPANNEVTRLELIGWKVGSLANTPVCEVLWGTPVFAFADYPEATEEEWKISPPEKSGTWYVRASVPAGKNWGAASKIISFALWDNPEGIFADHVKINVANTAGKDFTDYPLTLTFSEGKPVGFSYDRAGDSGEDLIFVSGDGLLQLPYQIVDTWNPAGESKVTVYLKTLPKAGTTIDLYWNLRPGQEGPAQPTVPATPAATDSRVTATFGTVEHDGLKVDSWRVEPTLALLDWNVKTPPASLDALTNRYALASGEMVSTGFYDIYDPSVTNALASAPTAPAGVYRAVFQNVARADWEPIVKEILFVVAEQLPRSGIAGNKGDSGRVLLMNRDSGGGDDSLAIDYQGFCDVDEGTSTFWQFLGDDTYNDTTYNLKAGTNCVLWTVNYGRRLWQLVNCRHGNTYNKGDNKAATGTPTMNNGQNYLPWSKNSYPIDNRDPFAAVAKNVGQVVMRNALNAAVYSTIYSNGVGTIYFDAVNGWTDVNKGPGGANAFQIVVEMSTNPAADATTVPESDWSPLKMHPVHVKGSTLTPKAATECLALDVTTGGAKDEFYRVYVPVNHKPRSAQDGGFRFRIRRVTINESFAPLPDITSLILLDNIIVSYPAMTADLKSSGFFNPARRGTQTLGWEAAMKAPSFPSMNDGRITARATPVYYTNDLDPAADPAKFIVSAKLHYRWRYLNQLVDDWNKQEPISFDPITFTALAPLKLPGRTGDVEYWFETRYQAPYYRYTDYSGQNLADKLTEIYTEEVTHVDNYLPQAEYERLAEACGGKFPSGGTNWFFRLREGASDNETVRIVAQRKSSDKGWIPFGEAAMEVISDGSWRGFLKAPEAVEGGLRFHLETITIKETTPGSFAFKTNFWRTAEDILDLPRTLRIAECGADDWHLIPCDGTTGYLSFQYEERTASLTATRADYQDFNMWSSAANAKFVGSSVDTNSTSIAAGETNANLSAWALSVKTNPDWKQNFKVDEGVRADAVYPKNQPFSSARAGAWLAEDAMWTYGKWTHESWTGARGEQTDHITTFGDDSAVQLEGRGKGSLSFVSTTSAPKGLDTVKLTTRLAQFNDFHDFTYWKKLDIDWSAQKVRYAEDMTNYTFATFANLSDLASGGGNDFSGDGTISLAAYYTVEHGCYEARFSRGSKDTNARIRLLRWSSDGYQVTSEDLGFQEVDDLAQYFLSGANAKSGGLFLSVEECPAGTFTGQTKPCTLVQAGFLRSRVNFSSSSDTPQVLSDKAFMTVAFRDESEKRLTHGAFGLLTANCNAVLRKPAYWDKGVGPYTAGSTKEPSAANTLKLNANRTVTFPGTLHYSFKDRNEYYSWWTMPPGRLDTITTEGANIVGFRTKQPAPTFVDMQIASHGGSDWKSVASVPVSSFADVTTDVVIRNPLECDVRLKVQGDGNDVRTDVVVNDIEITQWRGQETPNLAASGEYGRYREFVYTGGWVEERNPGAPNPGRVLSLQPARAYSSESPLSLRSPLLSGVGLIHFAWRNADSHCKLHLQLAEDPEFNILRSQLLSMTREKPDSEKWTTLATWDFSKMSAADRLNCTTGVTYYVNHRAPTACVLRLVIDRDVVASGMVPETARANAFYGGLQFTEAYVWDLPAYDARSWSGWNMRVAGWLNSEPDGFANIADATRGYSCILNNTLDASTLADSRPEHYEQNLPYVQTPTFLTNCIGEVVFKARVHNVPRSGNPSVVTVYGANKLDAKTQEPTGWEEVGDVVVDVTTFQTYTLKFKASESYRALRFAVKGVDGVIAGGRPVYNPPAHVLLDSVCVLEQAPPSIRFRNLHVRPFRDATAMKALTPVPEEIILSPDGQPLLSETFGFQAELELQINEQGDIRVDDPRKPITVELSYYVGDEPWGYANWKDSPAAVHVPLVAAEGTNLIFRSSLAKDRTIVQPVLRKDLKKSYGVVQYHMTARYYDRAGDQLSHELSEKDWSMPSWYAGMADPNKAPGAKFSAFTVLDEISPGRAWINEVNYVEDGKNASLASQWIELAVPSDIDMTDWSLDVYNRQGNLVATMVTLGRKGAPEKKSYSAEDPVGAKSHYAFYTIKSPNTVLDDADAVWAAFGSNGSLSYTEPYGFVLKRPSGIVEHRIVTEGDAKQYEEYFSYYQYTGTNLVQTLDGTAGGSWTFAGADPLKTGDGLSVTNGHGVEESDWAVRPLTPGHSNDGQDIPVDWFIPPNGGFVWIYSTVFGDHMRQIIGGETNKAASLTIQQGLSTNIVFEVDRWWQLGKCEVTPAGESALLAPVAKDGKRYYTLELNHVSNRVDVAAEAAIDAKVEALMGTEHPEYRPAVMKWLENGVTGNGPFKNPEGPLTNGYYRGNLPSLPLPNTESNKLDLVHLYWLDLDPTVAGWELWGGMGAKPGSAGTLPVDEIVMRERVMAGGVPFVHTNHVTSVWLELKNDELGLDYPPYRLQGLANEQSDNWSGVWTSVNFKVTMSLNNGKVDWVFQPMRYFVFDRGSFCDPNVDPTTPTPFAAKIEITDPFSDQSPAAEWGWKKYESMSMREHGLFTRWRIDGRVTPGGVSTLKKDDSLDRDGEIR